MKKTCNKLPNSTLVTVEAGRVIAVEQGAPRGTSAQSIRRACDTGEIQCVRLGGQGVRAIFRDSLLEWIAARRREG